MFVVNAAFAMLAIILVALVIINCWLVVEIIMHLLVIVIHVFLTSASSLIESLIVITIIPLLRPFVISLLALPLIIIILILAS